MADRQQFKLELNGFATDALYSLQGLKDIDAAFVGYLSAEQPQLAEYLQAMRCQEDHVQPKDYGHWLCETAPFVEAFIAQLFCIHEMVDQVKSSSQVDHPIVVFKKEFVVKRARKRVKQLALGPSWSEIDAWRVKHIPAIKDLEWSVAIFAVDLLQQPEADEQIERLSWWCAHLLANPQPLIKDWVSFKLPDRLDMMNLVPTIEKADDPYGRRQGIESEKRQRQGFAWTDQIWPHRHVYTEAHYCIFCHEREGDFCRTGFPIKKGQPDLGLRKNVLDEWLVGCPLDQRISEMNWLKSQGYSIASFAVVMIDNPMCPATGQRICNECMKACIFQKQTPVDIPRIESALLKEVINLPWGVEIYHLLTQWNPLRLRQYLPQPYQGDRVAIMGMGPAGFTMAHHLLMEGCAVVGFDGQPLPDMPASWYEPIYSYQQLERHLLQRDSFGFGGVAEYGITARWDKNLLSLLLLTLLRRQHFQCYGQVRFGGTWGLQDAWVQGFDHVVIAVGAGLPNTLYIPGSMAPGMRTANDFLMALHLGVSGAQASHSNLEVCLPAVVVGGGLTAVDTATELQAYYLQLVEDVYVAFATLKKQSRIAEISQQFAAQEWSKIMTWVQHGGELCEAKKQSLKMGDAVDLHALLQLWGGVTIIYRKRLIDSPAYRSNHAELQSALSEGVLYLECYQPIEILTDDDGYVSAVVLAGCARDEEMGWQTTDHTMVMPVQSVWTATGTQLNVAYSFEHAGALLKSDHFQYQPHIWSAEHGLQAIAPALHCKGEPLGLFTQIDVHSGVSFIGDSHPSFHGSVVKAMGSAKRGYGLITKRLQAMRRRQQARLAYRGFVMKMQDLMSIRLVNMTQLAPDAWQLDVHAPMMAAHWQPGTFCRWQPTHQLEAGGRLQPSGEPVVLMPISVDLVTGMISLVWVGYGRIAASIESLGLGQNLLLMGPTGIRGKLPEKPSTVLFFAERETLPAVIALLPQLKQRGIWIALVLHDGPKEDILFLEQIEQYCDRWVLAGVEDPDWSVMPHEVRYWQLLSQWLQPHHVTDVRCYVTPPMLKALQHGLLEGWEGRPPWLAMDARLEGRAMGPMQCMLKGVCAQCLQWQVDPKTGRRTKAVYGCSWQNQPLIDIDLDHLSDRQMLNKIKTKWESMLWQVGYFDETGKL